MIHLTLPLLSIIIPTKNEAKNIIRCITSCLNQTYRPLEIIIVDNHSTDSTLKIAQPILEKKCSPNYSITKLLNYQLFSYGPERSAQRNFGAKKAHGQYFLFIDADMELSPQVVEEIMHTFTSLLLLEKPFRAGDPPTGGDSARNPRRYQLEISQGKPPTGGNRSKWDNSNLIISIPELGSGSSYWEKVIALDKNCYYQETAIHAARAFPAKLFHQVSGYNEHLYAAEDWDLTLRCQAAGAIPKTINSPITHHESAASLQSLLAKDRYYIQNISKFRHLHPNVFAKFSSLSYRLGIYLKNFPTLIRHPFLTAGLVIYKLFSYLLFQTHQHQINR